MSDVPQDNGKLPNPKGGPRSVAGRAKVGRNAVKHGGFSRAVVPQLRHCPSRPACGCEGAPEDPCPLFSELHRRLTRQLANLPHLRPEHRPVILEFVGAFIRSQLIDLYLQRVGLVKTGRDGLDTHPVMFKVRGHLSHLIARLSDQLALNPVSAKAMGLSDPIDVGGETIEEIRDRYAAQEAAERAALEAPREPEEPERQEGQE